MGRVNFHFFTDVSANSGTTTNESISLNKWHHLVGELSVSDNKIRVYVDGVMQAATTPDATTIYYAGGDAPHFGKVFGCGGQDNFYTGKMDDVRIYNRALSAGEVKQLYNTGR